MYMLLLMHVLLFIQSPVSSAYTPIDSVTVEVDGPEVSANECSDLSSSDRSCNFSITEDGMYTVKLNAASDFGTALTKETFNCKLLEQ